MQYFCCKLFLKSRLSCQQTRNLWQMSLNLDCPGCSLMAAAEGNRVNSMLLFSLFYSCIFSMLHSWRGEVALEVFVSGQAAASIENSFLDSRCIHISIGSLDICENGLTKVRTTRIWPCSRQLLSFAGNSALLIHLHQSLHLHQPHERLEPVCRY
jgi:hypothetical protein